MSKGKIIIKSDSSIVGLIEELRKEFLKWLTYECHDGRRKDYNCPIFIGGDEKDCFYGKAVFNVTELDMVMEKFDRAIKEVFERRKNEK